MRGATAEIDPADEQIPLPNVSGKILAKVVEYCKYHVDAEKKDEQGGWRVGGQRAAQVEQLRVLGSVAGAGPS